LDVNISLSQEEQAAFMRILDAAVKHLGLGAVDAAVHFKNKITSAQLQAGLLQLQAGLLLKEPAAGQDCEALS
jgi:hypothetical protein